jgi:hypothetical protein
MMKDFLQPEKIKELSTNPEVLEIQMDPTMIEIYIYIYIYIYII